jgi:hypothetical protein
MARENGAMNEERKGNMISLRPTPRMIMIVAVAGFCLGTSTGHRSRQDFISSKQDGGILATSGNSTPNNDRVTKLISFLLSNEPDEEKRLKAEGELVKLGTESSVQRSTVIQKLLQSVERQIELNGKKIILGQEILFWGSATRVFAQLKASEAIDVLIRCIACGNGYSGSFGEQPSMDALIQMGAMVVPALSRALLNDHSEFKEYKKVQIVLCLGAIGGSQATLALKRALRSETDKDVIWNIKDELRTMRRDARATKK